MAAKTPSASATPGDPGASGLWPGRLAAGGSPFDGITARSPRPDLEAFLASPAVRELAQQICEIGRRMWQRAYVDGNGGNLALRVGPDLALCTPTQISKGFMHPEDLCLVDLEGNQLAGARKRTSEILMHLQIMQRQPRAVASVHCHPPYSTGFAIAGVQPPTCLTSEFELTISLATAPYRTPGTPELGRLVADLVDQHNTILMANHGVVAWSHRSVEDAYFKIETLEAYCHTVLIASQLGKPLKRITPAQLQELLQIKQRQGIPDPRYGLEQCEHCLSTEWRPGETCVAAHCAARPANSPPDGEPDEALVQAIANQIKARTMI